eukprot:PhM_4_TR18061/c0_g1_i15/m.101806
MKNSQFFSSCLCQVLTSVVVLSYFITSTHAQCYADGSEGFALPRVNISGYGLCPRGYYCPNATDSDSDTWPVVCPPTVSCQDEREDYKYCPPQGPYEPMPCPAGWYCPRADTLLRCPSGSYCPLGSYRAQSCGGMSVCPEGTESEWDLSGLFVLLLVDICVISGVVYIRVIRPRRRIKPSSAGSDEAPKIPNMWNEMDEQGRLNVVNAVADRRGDVPPLTFTFNELNVVVPAADGVPERELLSGVTGCIRPGTVTAIM